MNALHDFLQEENVIDDEITWNLPVNQPQQPVRRDLDHRSVQMLEEMFSEVDIQKLLQTYEGEVNVERIAEYIVTNEKTIPKKKSLKRKATTTLDETMNSVFGEDEPEEGTKILDIVLKKLATHFNKTTDDEHRDLSAVRTFLGSVFYKLRSTTITHLLKAGNLKSMLIFGFFIQNGLNNEFKKYVNTMNDNGIWKKDPQSLLLQHRRRRSNVFRLTIPHHRIELDEFLTLLETLQKDFPHILDGIDLKEDADSFVYEPVQEAEQFDCGICFSSYSVSKRVSCGNPKESNCHHFCINCVREQANAATGEMPLAEGAVGLKCMDTDCDKPIYYGLIRNLLPSAIRKRMDDRIQEENLAVSGLQLERCKNCNFAAEMNVDKTVNKVFDCLGCGKQWCRLCEKEWNDEHFGVSCEEYSKKNGDEVKRQLENKLSEAVIRKCHRCNFQFIKTTGCNHIHCRCGATHCYLCNENSIKHDHYCNLPCKRSKIDPITNKCIECKKCIFSTDATIVDRNITKRIQDEAGIQINVPNLVANNVKKAEKI